jgi:DNA helicase-4
VEDWFDRYRQQISDFDRITLSALPESVPSSGVRAFFEIAVDREQTVTERNDRFVQEAMLQHADYFDNVAEFPLTERQREAALRDEDALLVVAGAGTGKTLNVVGKIGYLIERGGLQPDEVLALAFNRKAAREMRERVAKCIGVDMEIRTFHSIALEILQDVEGEKAAVGSIAEHEREQLNFVSQVLADLFADPDLRDTYIDFVVYHRTPAPYKTDFDSREEYLEYMAGMELMTLAGERVKSFEERLIADWLTLHAVRYEYEYPYEVNTASSQRRQYKPDFFLPDSGIYLEHFGVDRDGQTAPWMDADKYREGMEWKRKLHERHGTTLVETYSYERMEGTLLDQLEAKLRRRGVHVRPISEEELRVLVERPEVKDPVVALLRDFLVAFKANLYSLKEVRSKAREFRTLERAKAFLDLYELVYERYECHLRERREIDFADMIRRATSYVEESRYPVRFKRLVVDEFQDISRGRLRFLQALLDSSGGARLFAVGDDWQSIYGFTGSDVSIMREFGEIFEHHDRVDLDTTFRFTDRLARASSRFIQAGEDQLEKELSAEHTTDDPPVHCVVDQELDLTNVFDDIADRASGADAELLVLGRYNFSEPSNWKDGLAKHENLDGEFLTVHRAKGLEADYVVVVDLKAGKYGFPSGVRSDPLMRLILPESAFGRSEERRVFYVALTRAREEVYLLPEPRSRSPFLTELLGDEYRGEVRVHGNRDLVSVACPECHSGTLTRLPKSKYGEPWACQHQPYCSGMVPICNECSVGPLLRDGRDYRCQLKSCGAKVPRCDSCDLRMTTYTSKKHGYSANCPECKNIRRLSGWQ